MSLKYYGSDAPLQEILQAIQEDGCAVMTDVMGNEALEVFTNELEPYLSAAPKGRDNFTGKRTQRTGALIARAPMSREFVMDRRILGLAHEFLGPHAEKLTLNLTQAVSIHPGEGTQMLHRDREA